MIVAAGIFGGLAALLSVCSLLGVQKYAFLMKETAYPFALKWMFPASALLLDWLHAMEKWPEFTSAFHFKITALHGKRYTAIGCKMFACELLSASLLCLIVSSAFSLLAGGDLSWLGIGSAAAALVPFALIRELDMRLRRKQQQMIAKLPEFLNMLVLLVNAGETVSRAWIRTVRSLRSDEASPLVKELIHSARELEMNMSFAQVLDDFGKRCSLHEVSLFVSAVLLNYKRGGPDFVISLQALSYELWQRRKAVARTLGEEASSKLVFPMVLIFAVVMVIIATPAFIMMNE